MAYFVFGLNPFW